EDCASNIFARILNQKHWTEHLTRPRGATSDESVKGCFIAAIDNDLRTKSGHDIAHIDMPPIRAEGQALDPFRAVHGTVGPFICHFRMQVGVSSNAFLHLWFSPELRGIRDRKRISQGREVLRAGGWQLSQCRRVKRLGITPT